MRVLTEDLRDLAMAMAQDKGWSDDDIDQILDAADMLDFFFGQMQRRRQVWLDRHAKLERVAELAEIVQSESLPECVKFLESNEWGSDDQLQWWHHDEVWPEDKRGISASSACILELDRAIDALR